MCTLTQNLWLTVRMQKNLNKKADAMLEKYTKIADETFDSVLGLSTDCAKRVLQSNSHL